MMTIQDMERMALATVPGASSVDVERKAKILRKFGARQNINSTEWHTVAGLPTATETYAVGNTIDRIRSANAGDTTTISVEGHTTDGAGHLTFVTFDVELNGTTPVVLPVALFRANRARNLSNVALLGDVSVFDSTSSAVHLVCPAEGNQSLKCATSISDKDVWIVTSLDFSVLRRGAAAVDFEIRARRASGVFRTVFKTGAGSNGSGTVHMNLSDAPLIGPPNLDVYVRARTATASNVDVSASINGVLASVRY